jgi:hypothetical protein
VIAFSSCSKDDEAVPKPKEEDLSWGYFEGFVSGYEYKLKNSGYPTHVNPVGSSWVGLPTKESTTEYMGIEVMGTAIELNEHHILYVRIRNLVPSLREVNYIKHGADDSWDTYVWMDYFDRDEKGEFIYEDGHQVLKARYVPVPGGEPFRVEVTSVTWVGDHPIIEVSLEGTLHDEDLKSPFAPYIKARYGAR